MISSEERRQLEISFINQLDLSINELVQRDFSENDIATFTETVKLFLKFEDIAQYVIATLYDKVVATFDIVRPGDKVPNSSYRKLLKVALEIGDEALIDSLETFLAKEKEPEPFLILMEEQVRLGKSTANSEKIFISLHGIHKYDLKITNRFLDILGQGPTYLTVKFLNNKLFGPLRRYIKLLGEESPNQIEMVVPAIMSHTYNTTNDYIGLIIEIMTVTGEYTHALLEGDLVPHKVPLGGMIVAVLNFEYGKISVIKHMCEFLAKYHPDILDEFEDGLLITAEAQNIVAYAINVPTSNKRKILRKLIQMREDVNEENNLVEFIKHFPEYRSLLPML